MIMINSTSCQIFLILGKWEGYFIDNRALQGKASGDKWLIDVYMHFKNNNEFVATGSDDVGPFTITAGQIKGLCRNVW